MGPIATKFDDIYNEYHEKVSNYPRRLVGNNNAEDLTQEVFLKINNSLKEFKGESALSTWVYRIATNAALDKLKSRSYREDQKTVKFDEPGNEREYACAEEPSLSAVREAIRNEMNERIREFVDKLPPDFRIVIILSEIKDLKNQQIADILGISFDAVKVRMHRARARLKTNFEAGCDFYHDEEGKFGCDRKKKIKEPQ